MPEFSSVCFHAPALGAAGHIRLPWGHPREKEGGHMPTAEDQMGESAILLAALVAGALFGLMLWRLRKAITEGWLP